MGNATFILGSNPYLGLTLDSYSEADTEDCGICTVTFYLSLCQINVIEGVNRMALS